MGQKTGHITSRSTSNPNPASPETGPGADGRCDTQGQTSSGALPATGIISDDTHTLGMGTLGSIESHGSKGETAADFSVPIPIEIKAASIGTTEKQSKAHEKLEEKEAGQEKGQGTSDDSLIAAVKSQQAANVATAPATATYWSIIIEVLNESVRAPAATFFASLYSYSYACFSKTLDDPPRATIQTPALGIQIQVQCNDEARVSEIQEQGRCKIALSYG